MPRDSLGNYTLHSSNPVHADTIIESEGWANPTLTDIGNELKNSLDRAGRGGMTGPLLIADGVRAAPGIAFGLDTGSGFYRDPVTGAWFMTLAGQNAMELFLDTTDPDEPVPSINFHAAVSFGATTTTFEDGTRLLPGIRFTDEQQTGFYRAGTNDVGVSVGQTDMLRAVKADGVRFPYSGEGSQISLRRGESGRIAREYVTAGGTYQHANGLRLNAAGDNLIVEQAQAAWTSLSATAFSVLAATGQVIGNNVTGQVNVLTADATGVYSKDGKLITAAEIPPMNYLPLTGGTLTGPLTLAGAPTVPLHAATKAYADLMLPLTGGSISGDLSVSGTLGSGAITSTGAIQGTSLLAASASPTVGWNYTSGGTNLKRYHGIVSTDGNLYVQALNDGGSPMASWLFARDGRLQMLTSYASVLNSAGACYELYARDDSTQPWQWYAAGGTMRFYNAGGTGGGDKANIDKNGNFTAVGNVTAYSDERLKEDLRPLEGIELNGLRALRYKRKDSGMEQVGVTAQALREVLPECVHEGNDGTLSVDYGRAALVLLLKHLEGEAHG